MRKRARYAIRMIGRIARPIFTVLHRLALNPLNRWRNAGKPLRQLEIGPGPQRIAGFETLNVISGPAVDYVADATRPLPFADNTFDLIYASHVLEHIPWHISDAVLKDWVRLLKPGGSIEIWLPDGYKLCKLLCDLEEGKSRAEWQDGWRSQYTRRNPYRWANGRLLYGIRNDYPSWHKAIFTPRSLEQAMARVGLVDIRQMKQDENRSVDHGWINLGFRGTRP